MQVIFGVADVARSREFYDRAFSWPRNPLVAGFANYVEGAAWFADPDRNLIAVAQRVATNDAAAQPF